ncbi:hypothetical protein AMJ57_00370 [Parcubacteria bacterium SG8_24]|nr:MAG: hypothetical protein AMJ57_00370 [Parcubacteria bacterium SG8_24]
MRARRPTDLVLVILLVAAPFGTRYIWQPGRLGGDVIEAGTASLFLTQLLAVFFVSVAFMSARRVGRDIPTLPLVIATSFLVGWSVVAAAWSGDPRAFVVVGWVVLGAALLFACRSGRPDVRLMLQALVVGATLQAGLALVQSVSQIVPASTWLGTAAHDPSQAGTFVVEAATGRWLRAYGTLSHPNLLGMHLAAGLLGSVALLYGENRIRSRRTLVAAATLLACGLFLTFSRSAFIGLMAGAAWMAWGAYRRRLRLPAMLLPFLTVLILSSAFLTAFLPDLVSVRLGGQERLEERSVRERVTGYGEAWNLLVDRPWSGTGPGLMPYALAAAGGDGGRGWDFQYVHNTPLLVAVETGILGALSWIAVVLAVLISSWRRSSVRERPESVVLPAIFLALCVAGLFDHFVWSSWFGQSMFWLLAGLAVFGHYEPVRSTEVPAVPGDAIST